MGHAIHLTPARTRPAERGGREPDPLPDLQHLHRLGAVRHGRADAQAGHRHRAGHRYRRRLVVLDAAHDGGGLRGGAAARHARCTRRSSGGWPPPARPARCGSATRSARSPRASRPTSSVLDLASTPAIAQRAARAETLWEARVPDDHDGRRPRDRGGLCRRAAGLNRRLRRCQRASGLVQLPARPAERRDRRCTRKARSTWRRRSGPMRGDRAPGTRARRRRRRQRRLHRDIWEASRLDLPRAGSRRRVRSRRRARRPWIFPLEDDSYDAVISGQMLEHNAFFWLTFLEMARVLKMGGLMIHIAPSRGARAPRPAGLLAVLPRRHGGAGEMGRARLHRGDHRLGAGAFRVHRASTAGMPAEPGSCKRRCATRYDLGRHGRGVREDKRDRRVAGDGLHPQFAAMHPGAIPTKG